MVFGLVFSIYFPMRATNSLMAAVRTALPFRPAQGLYHPMDHRCFLYRDLIVTIALTLSLMTFGERALWYTVEHFRLPEFLAKLWVTPRFPVAGAVSFLALFLLYALAQDTIQPLKNICPGVLFSSGSVDGVQLALFLLCQPFLPLLVLYGSIGAVIVVLIWLNLSAFIDSGCGDERCAHQHGKDRLEQGVNVPKT